MRHEITIDEELRSKLKKIEKHQAHYGRCVPCSCGHCGCVWDTKNDLCVANFIGPDDQEQPIAEATRQTLMNFFCKAANIAKPINGNTKSG